MGARRVVVAGGSGFVGANLVRRLAHDGHEVHLLVRPTYQPWRLEGLSDDVRVVFAELEDAEAVGREMRAVRPEWVFSLAAHGAYPAQSDPRAMVATNVVGTLNLAEAAIEIGVEAFVHAGSSSEYGRKDHPASESERLEPTSHYGVTKASATLLCSHLGTSRGAPLRTLRLYSVYGPWEEPTRLMPQLALRGLGGSLPPLADPRTARDYVYVADVVEAFLAAAMIPGQDPGAVYNVGTGVQTSLREVVGVASRELAVTAEPLWGSMPDRTWDTDVWVADNRLVESKLGWRPGHNVSQGFAKFAAWLRDDPELLKRYRHLERRWAR
jgi:nucleoside-diphosphate-sugar epimerase